MSAKRSNNVLIVLYGTLAITTVMYLLMYTMFLSASELPRLHEYSKYQAAVGEHNIYNWTNHQHSAHTGDEYDFKTSCPNRDKPPKHMYVLRHTERLDFLYRWWHPGPFAQWTERAFDKEGM